MGSGGGGNDLAKALLAEIKVQWYEFVGWVDEFYKQLTEEANFKAKPAWRLVGRCASAIFDGMAEPRSKVALLDDPTPLENKARIIWCVLQCHTIMRSFINVWFQGHPVIVKEITMFMVTERVDPAELDNMRTRLVDSEVVMKATKAALKRVEENYNTLKRSLDNMMKEFRPIKAKVVAAKDSRFQKELEEEEGIATTVTQISARPVGPQKERGKDTVKSERPTLRGLTTGSVSIRTETAQVECVIICHTYLSWIFVLMELGLSPRLVLLSDPTYLEIIQRFVGESCRILVGSLADMSVYATSLPDVRVALIDGSPNGGIIMSLEGLGVDTIYHTRQLRRSIPGGGGC
jgi:hypothetical protein